jgi:hypothetical protein
MAVLDTGPIDNRDNPRTAQLAIRLLNTGRMPAIAGIEVYHVNPTGTMEHEPMLRIVIMIPFK